MTSTATGPTRSRGLRAAAFGLVSVVVAAFGHAAGHGAVPSVATLAGALVVAVALGALVSGTRWSAPRLLAALTAVQLVVHGAAWVAAGSGGPVDPRLAGVADAAQPDAHAAHASPFTVRMLLAHALAVVGAAVLLAVVEHAAVTAAAAARRLLLPSRILVPSLPQLRAAGPTAPVVHRAQHLTVVRGNAPPLTACI